MNCSHWLLSHDENQTFRSDILQKRFIIWTTCLIHCCISMNLKFPTTRCLEEFVALALNGCQWLLFRHETQIIFIKRFAITVDSVNSLFFVFFSRNWTTANSRTPTWIYCLTTENNALLFWKGSPLLCCCCIQDTEVIMWTRCWLLLMLSKQLLFAPISTTRNPCAQHVSIIQ